MDKRSIWDLGIKNVQEMSQKKKNREGDETHIQRFSFCLGFGRVEFVLRSLDFFFWLLAWKEWPLFEYGAYFCLL